MKNKIVFGMMSLLVASGVSFAILANVDTSFNRSRADQIQPGTITIDVNDPNVALSDGTFTYRSALGNAFQFQVQNISVVDGAYKIPYNGYIRNTTPINGITQMTFTTPKAQSLSLGFKLEGDAYYDGGYYDLSSGTDSVNFENLEPTYIQLTSNDYENGFLFTRIVISYSCVADYHPLEIVDVRGCGVEGYVLDHAACLYAKNGDDLDDIDLTNFIFYDTHYNRVEVEDGNDVSRLSISYNEVDSDVVLEGSHEASISFVYNNYRYHTENFDLVGYDSVNFDLNDVYLNNSFILQKANDNFPGDLAAHASGDFYIYDSKHDQISHEHVDLPITITESMIVEYNSEHPYTELGRHIMTVLYDAVEYDIDYEIYNPEICNIRSIMYYDTPEIAKGTSNTDFLTYIEAIEAHVAYYEDKGGPSTVYLEDENFLLTPDMFNTSLTYVEVPIEYEGYSGTIHVHITLSRGGERQDYTNAEGVFITGVTAHKIALYNNGVCELEPDDELDSNLHSYTLVGTTLSMDFGYYTVQLTIDEEHHTFEEYVPEGTLLYTLSVDFSALGGGNTPYTGRLYDSNIIVFEVGMTMNCAFTYDPEDNHIIYFNFAGMSDCRGVIDYEHLTMVVTPIA